MGKVLFAAVAVVAVVAVELNSQVWAASQVVEAPEFIVEVAQGKCELRQ